MPESKVKFDLDFAFYEYLKLFYEENKGSIRQNYRAATKKYLEYNNPATGAYLRQPQFEALEIYVFLKEYLNNDQMSKIFNDWFNKKNKLKNRSDVKTLTDRQLAMFGALDVDSYQKVFEQYRAFAQEYSNYIYALSMGTGKTILMATCIFYEFILANKHPGDLRYCHNALVFAPDKTVLQSLREIQTIEKKLVVPPEYLNWLETHLQFHHLDESGLSLNTIDRSKYNIVISNTQKIILKRQNTPKTITQELFSSDANTYIPKGVFAEIQKELGEEIVTEFDLTVNQRFQKLIRLEQLGIYVDEAHHAFGAKLASDFGIKKTATSLRLTINEIAANIEKAGSKVVACYNYTGTPYIGKHILPEVVYSYGLKQAITNKYLKKVRLHSYTNPVSKEFVDVVIDDFCSKHNSKTYEGKIPKLAIFARTIDELEQDLRPLVEEAMSRNKLPIDTLLVNVGDDKITSNDDIREFNNLDKVESTKQIILLVNKGREGWNCRSLFGVALYRKPRSKIFVLQATMRCLREIGPAQETAQVYLSEENKTILNNELEENFRLTTSDLEEAGTNKVKYSIKLVPPKVKLKLKRVRKLHTIKELDSKNEINFDLENIDFEKYKLIHTEQEGLDSKQTGSHKMVSEDISHLRIRRTFSELSLVAEISRYLNRPCIEIEEILSNSKDSIDKILGNVNDYNDILYDVIIPKLFHHLYELQEYIRNEEEEIDLAKLEEEDELVFQADPNLVYSREDDLFKSTNKKSFHISPYCFDSNPEKQLFFDLVNDKKIKKVYFTGMLTHGQSDFYIQYIDPFSHTVRSYYPDFLVLKNDGSWLIIEVKGDDKIDDPIVKKKEEFANQLAEANLMTYRIIKGTDANEGRYKDILNL